MRFSLLRPLRDFFRTQAAASALLLGATLSAVLWANSPYAGTYARFVQSVVALRFGDHTVAWPLRTWVNDGLMALFFLVAGMEVKRELVVGELRSWGRAMLPLLAASGGMVIPAGIYLLFNRQGSSAVGWGIPTATDIAFALGCLNLLGRQVPSSLSVFLTALAIFDDLGAILVIALFYGHGFHGGMFALAIILVAVLSLLAVRRVQRVAPYLIVGGLLWITIVKSGLHGTLAGVVLGLLLPARAPRRPADVLDDLNGALDALQSAQVRNEESDGVIAAIKRHLTSVQPPLDRLQHTLHGPVAFVIVPFFAFANAGLAFAPGVATLAVSPPALGAFFGLALGKPLGVFSATYAAVRLGLAPKPTHARWSQIAGVSLLAGIGFTLSIFLAGLAFPAQLNEQSAAKIGIFAASVVSALLGLLVLRAAHRTPRQKTT